MFPYTVLTQDEDSATEFSHFPQPPDLTSSDRYGNLVNGTDYTQNEWAANSVNPSTLHMNDGRQCGRWFQNNFDGRFISTDSVHGLEGNKYSVDGELCPGQTSVADGRWIATAYSRSTQSSSHSAENAFELAVNSINNVWENCGSNADSRESSETPAPGDESSDGETESKVDPNLPYDPAKLESIWTEPTQCFLGGCRPGRLFRTYKSWHSHVKNVHKKTLRCPEPDCGHTKPFANNTDLKRHIKTVHEVMKSFMCERPSCSRTVKTWSRKDKLRLHNRKYHSNFRCFLCSQGPRLQQWFDTAPELWAHTLYGHLNG